MSRRSLALRALVPVAIALCSVGATSTAAWAATPGPAPAEPIRINDDECVRDHGRIVIDRNDHRIRRCEGGPHNGREIVRRDR